MSLPSEGAIALAKYLTTTPNAAFARAMDVSAMTVSHWKNFTNAPRGWHRERIHALTGIEPEAWDRPAPPEEVERVVQALEARARRRQTTMALRAEAMRRELEPGE